MAIRNFCIIAHIDHGKSTLADRLMELTGTVTKREMKEQLLDQMDLEREKGITIKLQPVRMEWEGDIYNLIDTPGHVDFQYEVSRSLAAVEGAILLVDATQGVQAQTISNLYLALEQDLTIIPIINKIDLPAANVEKVTAEIANLLGDSAVDDIVHISAKTGKGVDEVLAAIKEKVPVAQSDSAAELSALVFDSVYDDYKGVVAYVRIMAGKVKQGEGIKFIGTKAQDRVVEAGTFAPSWNPGKELVAGEIGYIATGLKDVRQARVGDTITVAASEQEAVSGFTIPQPKVFASVFPQDASDYPVLREAINELMLNDASLTSRPESSAALGQGFQCGFLGLLHAEIIAERLRREYDLDLVMTTPSVSYKVLKKDGEEIPISTPSAWPDPSSIESIEEQYVKAEVITPQDYLGPVFELMQNHEGKLLNQSHLDSDRLQITYELPLRNLVVNLYDQLKSATAGHGSISYEIIDWRPADVVKLAILANQEPVEALAQIVARVQAETLGRKLVKLLKEKLPRQQFAVPIQAAIGGTIIARETIPAMRKDVTAKLYGGDVTRKRKLLEKQKKGKKKLASSGSLDIPPDVYRAVLHQ